jgi:hypothetical protein
VIRQHLALIPAPPGTIGMTWADTHVWSCAGCHAVLSDGKIITHTDACPFIAGVVERAGEAVADKARDEVAEWEWATPIPENYVILGGTLRCTDHGSLYSIGQIELWEFALDAKRHHQEQHGGES